MENERSGDGMNDLPAMPESRPQEADYQNSSADLPVLPPSNRTPITEEMGLHKGWYEEARKQTLETLPAFLNKLGTEYEHDYGTICYAVAASAISAACAVNHGPSGGITGFQAGIIMWEFIRHWMHNGEFHPLRMIDFSDMLYPQYEEKFQEKIISGETWKWIQNKAIENLNEIRLDVMRGKSLTSPKTIAHWESIAGGNVPFGFTVKNES